MSPSHSRLPTAQILVYVLLAMLCAVGTAFGAAAHVYHHVPMAPPPHVMHFQCVTLSFVVLQQMYYYPWFIVRFFRPNAGFLNSKVDVGFIFFCLAFGTPTTFINTSKIVEFSGPWRRGDPIPLPWKFAIADTIMIWLISAILWAWVITEIVTLYKRFGLTMMWRVNIPTLNGERTGTDAEFTSKGSLDFSEVSHGFHYQKPVVA